MTSLYLDSSIFNPVMKFSLFPITLRTGLFSPSSSYTFNKSKIPLCGLTLPTYAIWFLLLIFEVSNSWIGLPIEM